MKSPEHNMAEFSELNPETIDSIPRLQDPEGPGKRIWDAVELHRKLAADLKRVRAELSQTGGPTGPAPSFSQADDAQALLAGEPVESLQGPTIEDKRAELLRQLRALERAVPAAENRIGPIESRVIQEECLKLLPIGRAIVEETVGALENLIGCLETESQFFQLLARRGFRADKREPQWSLLAQQQWWLFGAEGMPNMRNFLEQRAKAWGLPAKRKVVV